MASTHVLFAALLAGSLSATSGCADDPADPPAIIGSWRVGANVLDVGALPVEARQVVPAALLTPVHTPAWQASPVVQS